MSAAGMELRSFDIRSIGSQLKGLLCKSDVVIKGLPQCQKDSDVQNVKFKYPV
jgi:hypothetical protein